ncbi:hypothetical protein D039_1856A, partial [Vibrio parahaemolyticus EKP-028]
MAYHDSLIL